MYNMNSGYNGYSMSNRAREAYENGEKPLSKWTKADIMQEIKDFSAENKLSFTMSLLAKAPKAVITDLVLIKSSWHHTSSYVNCTDFYKIDTDILSRLTDERIEEAIESHKTKANAEPYIVKYKGTIEYLEWSGTKKHPKATKCELKDVNIEGKGCFYLITDTFGNLILKKKIGSNGTYVTRG